MVQADAVMTGTTSDRRVELSARAYFVGVALIIGATVVIRVGLGSRGSFTGDDFEFRAAMSVPFSLNNVLQGHNGHLNPVGLTLQWLVQHAFPGRFVPLMVLSAFLVVASQFLCSLWVAEVFGRRALGWAAVTITGLSPMLLELSTWWSVALYAAPMVATSWLTVLLATRYLAGAMPLWAVAVAYALCLGSSTKAVLIPVLVVGLAAALGLGTSQPLGFRRALAVHRRLWFTLAGLLIAYGMLFLAKRGPISSADPSPSQMWDFVTLLFRNSVFPAIWGGPWTWVSLGFHAVPLPSGTAMWLSATLVAVGVGLLVSLRPRTWRMVVASAVYMLLSAFSVSLGRAGSAWGAPVLRYTFDLVLPVVLVVCSGLASTRWERDQRSRLGRLAARWSGWYTVGGVLAVGYATSLVMSYALPWSILPNMPMKSWVANARTAYPSLDDGLLEQRAPVEIAPFPEDLDVFLAGDPGKPPEVAFVLDRALGFDAEGHLIQRHVVGVSAVPAADCAYRTDYTREALIPLEEDLPPGRHTVMLEYSLDLATAVDVRIGGGDPVTLALPEGVRRTYSIAEGAGGEVKVAVRSPNAAMCILNVTVGDLVDGDRVVVDGG